MNGGSNVLRQGDLKGGFDTIDIVQSDPRAALGEACRAALALAGYHIAVGRVHLGERHLTALRKRAAGDVDRQ